MIACAPAKGRPVDIAERVGLMSHRSSQIEWPMPERIPAAASHYLEHIAPGIDGWLHTVSRFIICNVDYIQRENNIAGNIAEIGLWEAKTANLFSLLSENRNKVHSIDIEIRPAARSNIEAHAFNGGENLTLVEKSSLDVTKEELLAASPTKFRFFHVDGYHTFDVAKSDLALAFATTHDTGVIALDDFYASTLPGVTEALYEAVYMGRNNGFVPFALGGAKVYLCKEEMVDFYRDKLLDLMLPMESRTSAHTNDVSRMFGRVVAIYDLW